MKPITGGVYFLYHKGKLVYIGQSNNVFSRIGQHINEGTKVFDDFLVYETNDHVRLESFLIASLRPKYNKTNGNFIDTQTADKDKFSIQLPPGRVLELIQAHEQGSNRQYLSEIAKNHPYLTKPRVCSLILKHMDEIPVYRISHEWFIDKKWYEQNGSRFNRMISKWDNDEINSEMEM